MTGRLMLIFPLLAGVRILDPADSVRVRDIVQTKAEERASRGTSGFTRFRRTLDIRSGLVGGCLLAAIVWWINASHGPLSASTAALKQFLYTFFMGSLVMRLCTRLALRGAPNAFAAAVLVPSLVTVGATLVVHSVRGTPEPLLSTLPAAVLAPATFAVWARRVRCTGRTIWERP